MLRLQVKSLRATYTRGITGFILVAVYTSSLAVFRTGILATVYTRSLAIFRTGILADVLANIFIIFC